MPTRANPFSPSPDLHHLTSALRHAGYTPAAFSRIGHIGVPAWSARVRAALPTFPSRVATLLRLFLLRDAVALSEAREVLGEALVSTLSNTGVLTTSADTCSSVPMLIPVGDFFIACDPIPADGGIDVPDDFVLGASNAAHMLADLTVRVPGEIAVDVGCGQGFHSLLAARHAKRVIGTDINPRALSFARLNAAINGVSADLRAGSFFEPLADVQGKVSLLTCNPPFVMAPKGETTSLHTSLEGDAAVEHVVRGTPALLAPGAWASIIGLWHHPDVKDWSVRPREWLGESGCQALLLQFRTMDPATYFREWVGRADQESAWRDLAARLKIAAVTFGAIVLHKPADPAMRTWIRTQHATIEPRTGSASTQLQRLFRNQSILMDLATPEGILDLTLRAIPDRRFLTPSQGSGGQTMLAQTKGLLLPLPADQGVFESLNDYDGRRTAREVMELHAKRGQVLSATDPRALRVLSTLVAQGYFEVV